MPDFSKVRASRGYSPLFPSKMEPPPGQHQHPEARPGEASAGGGENPAQAGSCPSRRRRHLSPSPTLSRAGASETLPPPPASSPHRARRAPPAALTLGAARHRLHAAGGGDDGAARFGPPPRVGPGRERRGMEPRPGRSAPASHGGGRRRHPSARAAFPPSRESRQALARGRERRARGGRGGRGGRGVRRPITFHSTAVLARRGAFLLSPLPFPLPPRGLARSAGERSVREGGGGAVAAARPLARGGSGSRESWRVPPLDAEPFRFGK